MKQNNSQIEDFESLQTVLKKQPALEPSGIVRIGIITTVSSRKQNGSPNITNLYTNWLFGFGISTIVCVLLWMVIKPGVNLGWTVQGDPPASYQIYRELSSNKELELIQELEGIPGEESFELIDLFILPYVEYTYTVIGVANNGQEITRQTTVIDTTSVLPNQVSIILTSILFGICVVIFSKIISPPYAVLQTW